MTSFAIVLSVVFAVFRVCMLMHPELPELFVNIYKDLAHVYVGVLAGVWLSTGKPEWKWMFWGLCAVEVVCFVISRFMG